MKKNYLLFVLLAAAGTLYGQGSGLPLGNPAYHIMDRLEIKTGLPRPFHSAHKYYRRGDVVRYAMLVDTSGAALSDLDRQDLQYIYRDNNEWLGQAPYATTLTGPRVPVFPDTVQTQIEASLADGRYVESRKPLFGFIYPTPANLIEVNDKYFHLRLNPILNLKVGALQDEEAYYFFNQRGAEIRGGIDDRIYFYANILETQTYFPNHVREFMRKFNAVPGQGFYKSYTSDVFNITRGTDYLNGQGYLGFNISRHVGLQFGYGRNMIGNGYRSVLLSDFANNNLYLKLNTRVWKLHYQNIFAELAVRSSREVPGDNRIPKKYVAIHHLSLDLLPNLNIGIFEAVSFDQSDQFQLAYLNPIMFYRVIEQALGSPDNAMLGFDAKWNLWRRLQLYGQVFLDELRFRELFAEGRGWWGNKYGIQAGLKYIDALGIDHLDLQAEFNTVRPYTYTHRDSSASYSHYNQALAHPLGANFREFLVLARYQPLHKLVFEGRLITATFGEDRRDTNWGMNILLPYDTREQDYGNEIAQGIRANTLLLGFDVSYQLFHNVFLEAHYFYRNKDSEDDAFDLRTQYISGGVRMNIGRSRFDF